MVLVLPKEHDDWLTVDSEKLIARTCCYWCNLLPLEGVENEKKKRIEIYTSNLLPPDTLKKLMEKAAKREEIGHAL